MPQQEKTLRPHAPDLIPQHIAIIMDGNGRWAASRGLPRTEGHRRGVEAVRNVVRSAGDLNIKYLTLYCFSSENWKRPKDEIIDLMGLIRRFIRRDLADLHEHDVRIRVIGNGGVEKDISGLIAEAVSLTQHNQGLQLTVAFNYGARDEIIRATKRLAQRIAAGELSADDISHETFAGALDTSELPDPDLLIRSSGERRISNFLLWQCAYTEFVFVDTYWPDFTGDTLRAAIAEYQARDRRYGGLSAACSA